MRIVAPKTITSAMLGAGTSVAEPDLTVGEVAWVSGTSYAVGLDRTYQGSIYTSTAAITGTVVPPLDDRWLLKGPTNRMSPFDYYSSTQATAATSMTYVVNSGFFNTVVMYGLLGASYTAMVKDAPGGTILWSTTGYLYEEAIGLYELLFSSGAPRTKLIFNNLPISPTAEFTVTLTGTTVGLGTLNLGDSQQLGGTWGGTEYGAEAEPTSFSYIKQDDDGLVSIKRRHSGTGLRATVGMAQADADAAVVLLQSVLDIPVSVISTDEDGYAGLNVFGLISGSMRYDSFSIAKLTVSVKGFI